MSPDSSTAFTAISDPTRRAILRILGDTDEDGVAAGDIAREFPTMTRAAVSAHLRVLRHADLVSEERRGQFRYYSLGPNRADDIVQFLMSVYSRELKQFLDDQDV